MSDEHEEEVGSVKVSVTSRQITKAVRNILANEMKLDPVAIRQEVHAAANALIQKEVIDYLKGNGYGHAELQAWARRTVDAKAAEILPLLKEAVRELVTAHIREEVEQVVEGIIRDGIEVRVGWNRKAKVKVARADVPVPPA